MARWLGWVYADMSPRPKEGKGSVEDVVSHLSPVQRELASKAAQLASIARFRLDTLPEVRTGEAQIGLEKRALDWIVYMRESGMPRSRPASFHIEASLGILSGAIRQMGG